MAGARTTEPESFTEFRRAERTLWNRYGLEPKERLVQLGEEQLLRIHDIGEGEPVLFVHGTGGSGVYFAPLVAELAPAFRCILLDRPGWTLSSPIDYSAGEFGTIAAGLQRSLLDALGVERAHLIGGSIGNLYALRFALHHPGRTGHIVLLGGLPAEGLTPPMFLRLLRTPLGRIIARIPQRPPMIRKQMGGLGHQTSLDRGLIPEEYISMKAAESRCTGALRYERELVRTVVGRRGFRPGIVLGNQDLAAIEAPTMMVYGSQDPIGTETLWKEFTASLPNGTLNIIPDGGHLPWFDRPDDVGALILTHLGARPTSGQNGSGT